MHRRITGKTLLSDGQLEILERIEAGLDLGNKRDVVFAHDIDGQPICIEQRADVFADLQHDFINVAGGVYLIVDLIQILGEFEPEAHIAGIACRFIGRNYCIHSTPSPASLDCCRSGPGINHGSCPARILMPCV